jgi:hypothetical protein
VVRQSPVRPWSPAPLFSSISFCGPDSARGTWPCDL